MEYLKNDRLSIAVSEMGAELQSIKDEQGREYLWDGDKDYWPRHSPILFPIVCGLWNSTYRLQGKSYHMERHGFARDHAFKLISKTQTRVTFGMHEDDGTLSIYPFPFNLGVSYRLDGNTIHVIWHVENTGKETLHFQIGGHPAFLVPGCSKGQELKGKLRFDNPRPERLYGNVGGCIVDGRHPVETKDGIWAFTEDDFADDALIFDHSQLHQITLLDEQGDPLVTVNTKAPALGIWSPAGKHAPFVCIEPWYGIHDKVGYEGDFTDRYLMNHLLPGSSFMSEYTIIIGK